jgi:uncharacterized membrane protein YqiK
MTHLSVLVAQAGVLDWCAANPAFAVLGGLVALFVLALIALGLTTAYIPNNYVGVVEKLWSRLGSLSEGAIIALEGEAGYQADLLRGGLHFGMWAWQYRVHKVRLVTIPQGKIGYVYARDGEPLQPSQTLARVVPCNNFQDARAFLIGSEAQGRGQRGRQRSILREGVYAINPAMFVVISEDAVYRLPSQEAQEVQTLVSWQKELSRINGFSPVVVGGAMRLVEDDVLSIDQDEDEAGKGRKKRDKGTAEPADAEKPRLIDNIGIVTVQDGPSLAPGEIIAPAVGNDSNDANYHNNFQDPEAFLRAGGRRGRQYVPLTDGTYFINRWFATVEMTPKTVVPIGFVGVVVSYYGRVGRDTSGEAFRHGERVAEGERGVWERPLGPGKYPFNTYAGQIILVPTTNFVLHWITGRTEAHRYDESLRSIDLVTKDAYEPLLPLSVVVHIDYQKAPGVIQRFGDIKKLITQTLDPMLSAYFRDVAHKKTMLELLHQRDEIQKESREELRRKFRDFDIECVDVLIGKPDTAEAGGKIETLLEQLRMRQLSIEQLETYERQKTAAEKLRTLAEAQATATMQTQLTNASVEAQIASQKGEADLARARKQAEQTVVQADAELQRSRKQAEQTVVQADAELQRSRRQAEQTVLLAEAESKQRMLAGRGEAQKVMQIGLSEASVLLRKISSYGDPRLYALALVAEHLSHSAQPLVPERVFSASTNGDTSSQQGSGMLGLLINLLVAEKSGFQLSGDTSDVSALKEFADRMTRDAMTSIEKTETENLASVRKSANGPAGPVSSPKG